MGSDICRWWVECFLTAESVPQEKSPPPLRWGMKAGMANVLVKKLLFADNR